MRHKDFQLSGSEWSAVTPVQPGRRESLAASEKALQDMLRVDEPAPFTDRHKNCLKVDTDGTNRKSMLSASPKSFSPALDDFSEVPLSRIDSVNGNRGKLITSIDIERSIQ